MNDRGTLVASRLVGCCLLLAACGQLESRIATAFLALTLVVSLAMLLCTEREMIQCCDAILHKVAEKSMRLQSRLTTRSGSTEKKGEGVKRKKETGEGELGEVKP